MSGLIVDPEKLELLAEAQDHAADSSADAACSISKLGLAVWVTHGLVSQESNRAFMEAEAIIRHLGVEIAQVSQHLAAALRAAAKAYGITDQDLGDRL